MSVMVSGPREVQPAYEDVQETKSWRRWQDWCSLLLGLMLWICPVLFSGFSGASNATASITIIIAGTIIAGVAVWALAEPHVRELQGIIALTGAWLIMTPMMFNFVISDIIQSLLHWATGAIALVLALWALMDQADRPAAIE